MPDHIKVQDDPASHTTTC